MLRGAFDRNDYNAPNYQQEDLTSPVKAKYPTQNKKLSNLTSHIDTLQGHNANKMYTNCNNTGDIIDIHLQDLPPNMDEKELKRISGAKHVISAEIDLDALKGTCRGNGRIKIRLNDDEDKESIR